MAERQNPYTLIFGKEPLQTISRPVQREEVLHAFLADIPSLQIFMITGVRGIGKTVFMTEISNELSKEDSWISVELNPSLDMLSSLASKLGSSHTLARIFQAAKINLSFFGIGLEVSGTPPVTDIETALERMLDSLGKHGKRVLITIDEVTNTREMRIFASAFQIFLRRNLPVYLLMTGLYENLYELQNEKNLTFLYRAPKITLGPLNIGTIADNYRENLQLPADDALKMAQMTCGYSFAFQLLGYLTWQNGGHYEQILGTYKQYLEEYVYEKIWSEMSATDQRVAYGIATAGTGKISDIRALLHMTSNQFTPYRQRLIRKGLIDGSVHGYVTFTLPLFDEFVRERYIGF